MITVIASLGSWLTPIEALRWIWPLVTGFGSAAAIVVGVRRNRPAAAWPWWWMAAGMSCWGLGGLAILPYALVTGDTPFPSWADVFFLLMCPFMSIGVVGLIIARGHRLRTEEFIDTTIVTVGLGLLSWVVLMRPTVTDATVPMLTRVVGLAYPISDMILLAVFALLLTTRGARTPAFRLLVAGIVLLLAADSGFQLAQLATGTYPPVLDGVFALGCGAWGAAALHPSMRELTRSTHAVGKPLSQHRLASLALATLMSPIILGTQYLIGSELEVAAIVISSIVLFLLVLLRLAGLVAQLEVQANRLADVARTDELTQLPNRRTAVAALADAMHDAANRGTPLSLAIIDLDKFKAYNDTRGHNEGDRLLRGCAKGWSRTLGEHGLLARWGGEEFVIVFAGLETEVAAAILEQLRPATPSRQTFSAGLAAWDGTEDSVTLLRRADEALYAAKHGGRNRTVVAAAPTPAAVSIGVSSEQR